MTTTIIDKVNSPTRQELEQYIKNNKPFIITGVVNEWISSEKWKPSVQLEDDYFHNTINKVIPVREIIKEDGKTHQIDGEWLGKTTNIEFSTFWNIWRQHYFDFHNNNNNSNKSDTKEDNNTYYLASLPIQTYFKELQSDYEVPELPREQGKSGNLWIGFKDTITPLHHDWSSGDPGMDGLHAVVIGKKLFKLFDPVLNVNCFARRNEWGRFHQSAFDLDKPDYELYPEARNAISIDIELHAGEMLFIPKLWWHYVSSQEPSISVNFWFQHISSELLKCTTLWCHMEQYLNAVLNMNCNLTSNDKLNQILKFLTNTHNSTNNEDTDNTYAKYKQDTLNIIKLPKFINSFSNAVNNPFFKNHPNKESFKLEITEKVNQWIKNVEINRQKTLQ